MYQSVLIKSSNSSSFEMLKDKKIVCSDKSSIRKAVQAHQEEDDFYDWQRVLGDLGLDSERNVVFVVGDVTHIEVQRPDENLLYR